MSLIATHPLAVGLALSGVAYLNSLVTFPRPGTGAPGRRRSDDAAG